MRDIDRAATGEDRAPVLDALDPLSGLDRRARAARPPAGRSRRRGARASRSARADETAGVALIAAAAGGPGSSTIVVPDANAAAADALGRWGFAPTAAGARMRLGPAVAWRPEMQFGLFNLFWG